LFDTLEAVASARRKLGGSPLRLHLSVAGAFRTSQERSRFNQILRQPEAHGLAGAVEYLGFVEGERKAKLLATSDCLCFPTWYAAESFSLVLLEALASGLMILTTMAQVLPTEYARVVPKRSPERLAEALLGCLGREHDNAGRAHFLSCFTETVFAARIREALLSLE
jgi:glycosyltransferase involved in cell wall biosynthesis